MPNSAPPSAPTTQAGGCHCGAVRFTVRLENPTAIWCNCSMCTKKGFIHLIVEHDALTIESGADRLTEYRFHTQTARHTFCATCGIHPFYVPRSHPDGFSVNARCLDNQDFVATLPVEGFDGQNWEQNIHSIR
jgi:hypothetical protein